MKNKVLAFIVLGVALISFFTLATVSVKAEETQEPQTVETDEDGTFYIIDPETQERIKVKIVKAYDYFNDKVLPIIISVGSGLSALFVALTVFFRQFKNMRAELETANDNNRTTKRDLKLIGDMQKTIDLLQNELENTSKALENIQNVFILTIANNDELVKRGVLVEAHKLVGDENETK